MTVLMGIQSGQKTDTQFYFWDNFGNSAQILTILSLLITSKNLWRVNVKFFHPPHFYCVITLPSKTNTIANIGVECLCFDSIIMTCGCSSHVEMLGVSAAILDNSFKTSTPFKNSHSVLLVTASMNGVDVSRAVSHWRELFARTIRANVRVVVLAWIFTLTRMQMFASFALSNAIRTNNLRIKLIFDEYFTYWFRQAGSCIWNK